jgi:hypothetical protein
VTIISGGQTGADRAALDFAIEHGLPYEGWCPRGRLSEDGAIPISYDLQQTPSRRYAQRTEWNVRDSDATVVFTIGPQASGGTALAIKVVRRLGKPLLHLWRVELTLSGAIRPNAPHASAAEAAAASLLAFLDEQKVRRLNVAGPRASQEPDVAEFVRDVLERALRS